MFPVRTRPPSNRESGAILIFTALAIVVLMVFAALTVDLGAAWSERRQDQSAADAAAMAGALGFLEAVPPSNADIVAAVKSFVDKNISRSVDWSNCKDPDGVSQGFLPLEGHECISLKLVGAPTTLRVRVPDQLVETSFARVIGINEISVSAFAEATVEVRPTHRIIPFSLPAEPSTEECLGVPPKGHNADDDGPCADGSEGGNFGLIDSPWFGRDEPFYTGDVCDDKQQTIEERSEQNIAIGGDHEISVWADVDPIPLINTDSRKNGQGLDDCSSAEDTPPGVPYILHTETGTETGNAAILSDGMIGDGPYGSSPDGSVPGFPGRLRQIGGLNTGVGEDTITFNDGSGAYGLDNVGLWEYLTNDNGLCGPDKFSQALPGKERSANMTACLKSGNPSFSASLLTSPRFALVPSLNYSILNGDGWFGVLDLIPVYIQTTWYGCTTSKRICLFLPDDPDQADPPVPEDYSVFFNPGEGAEPPCYMDPNSVDCKKPTNIKLLGVSSYVLDGDTLTPEDWLNNLGNPTPFNVYLSR